MLHAAHFWTFSKRNACWHRRRNRLKEAVGVDEASCDTWRCLVHPVPLIITRDTRFLNSKWIPRGFSTPMPDFPSFILIPSTCWTKHDRTRHVSTRLVFFQTTLQSTNSNLVHNNQVWALVHNNQVWARTEKHNTAWDNKILHISKARFIHWLFQQRIQRPIINVCRSASNNGPTILADGKEMQTLLCFKSRA